MRTTYRVLASLVALGVVVQAAAIAYALFGLGAWVQDGGVLDKASMESASTAFTGDGGFAVHGIGGEILIPLLALALLVVSFFAKVPRGVAWAAAVVGVVVLQVLLGVISSSVPVLGALHGALALVLFGVAVVAARRTVTASAAAPAAAQQSARVA